MGNETSSSVKAFMDALTEPAMLLSADMRVVAVNAAMCRSLGMAEGAVLGQNLFGVLPPEVREHREAQFHRILATGEGVVFEDTRGGRHFLNHMSPARSPEGEVTAVAVYAIDITKQHQAERAMAESEARYRQIVTSCAEGIWQIDRDNRTVFVNEQMARMLGYTVDECVGRELFSFMDDDGKLIAQENLRRRQAGISERHDFRFVHKAGHSIWAILATSPLFDASGQYAGAIALATDVSERRSLEQKIQHAQKLESLGVLAGGIAHDFNNLLVGILGNAGLAQHELPPG
ncbi:MAG: PAS domain S-box protein [Planctomycetota bacterium]